jgi:hypothetical protein
MSQGRPNKIAGVALQAVLAHCKMPDAARALLAGEADAQAAISVLAAHGYLLEATRVYAQALPHREAVWWACMCVSHTAPEDLDEAARLPRELAEQWVRGQQDEVRRAAMAAAKTFELKTPEAWAGAAAFYSGDSITPVEHPPHKPAPHLTGIAVAAAVLLASLRGDASRGAARLARFLESAQDIAGGGPGRLPVETP